MNDMQRLVAKILFDAKVPIPIMLWGPPDAGKSTLVKGIAEIMGVGLEKNLMPYADFFDNGRYSIDENVSYRDILWEEGAVYIGIQEFDQGDEGVHYFHLPKGGEGIFLIPDLNFFIGGEKGVSPQLFAYRKIQNDYLGKGWRIAVTGIPPYTDPSLYPLQPHFIPLFCHLGMGCEVPISESDLVVDISYAAEKESFQISLHPEVEKFLVQYSEYENEGRAILRTWSYLSTCLRDIALECEELAMVAEGLVGKTAAAEFLAFTNYSCPEKSVQT